MALDQDSVHEHVQEALSELMNKTQPKTVNEISTVMAHLIACAIMVISADKGKEHAVFFLKKLIKVVESNPVFATEKTDVRDGVRTIERRIVDSSPYELDA